MNKHTPGPWVADLTSFKVCANEGKLEICRTYGGVRIAEEHANARLISAAPDLLVALRFLLADYLAIEGEKLTGSSVPITMAREAIAKAEGGAK